MPRVLASERKARMVEAPCENLKAFWLRDGGIVLNWWMTSRIGMGCGNVASRIAPMTRLTLLRKIELATIMLALGEDISWNTWAGDKRNRWYDTKHQPILYDNGRSGFWGEHSCMDGTPTDFAHKPIYSRYPWCPKTVFIIFTQWGAMSDSPGPNIPSQPFIYIQSMFPKLIALSNNQHVKIGRQTNTKTAPGGRNGYFDSKVLSRQHAEAWEDVGKIFIKDVKSSNGTFINGE
ncbi:hypothetical protein JOM56_000210 [Amanita muscaria]